MADNTSTEQVAAVEKPSDAAPASVKNVNVKIEFTEDSFSIKKGEVKTVDAETAKRLIDAHAARAK